MAETIMRVPPVESVINPLYELEHSLDSMRIYCELMTDQLLEHDAKSLESAGRLQERIILLMRSLSEEVARATELQSTATHAAFGLSEAMEGAKQ